MIKEVHEAAIKRDMLAFACLLVEQWFEQKLLLHQHL